jgi:hypothetical protein
MVGYAVTRGAIPKSIKRLKSSSAVTAFQKEYFLQAKEKASHGEPFIYTGIYTPHEIFEAMDIPFVVSMWWAAINAAKRLTGPRQERAAQAMVERSKSMFGPDYDQLGRCAHCTMGGMGGFAQLVDQNPEEAAYGGLPELTAIVESGEGGACPGSGKLAAIEFEEYLHRGRKVPPVFRLEDSAVPPYYPRYGLWWENIMDHWDELIEPYRLDYRVEELKALIKFLEITTGRTFNQDRLIEVMELVNEHNLYWKKARDLIAETVPCPADVVDQLAQYSAQWHRGTIEARDLAKMFYEEVKEKVEKKDAAYPDEKLRLQWLKGGNFGNTAFYQYFAEKYGAVFVATIYISIASDGYPRSMLNDPLRALAGRHLFLGLYHGPDWDLKEARHNKIDGAVMFEQSACQRLSHSGHLMYKQAYEKAGIPLCVISPTWDADKQQTEISKFIETRLLPKRT